MLPHEVKIWNLFIDGVGYTGRAEELTLPTLTRKTEEYRAGGMNAPVELDMGMEKLEMDFTLREYSPEVLKQFASPSATQAGLRFAAAALADTAASATDSIEIVARGRWREMEFGTQKVGDAAKLKVSVALAYFKYSLNGEAIIEIDPVNYIEVIGGVDRLKEQRTALGM